MRRVMGIGGWSGTAYSTFKRLFGECSLSRTLENIAHELVAKVALYNLLVNM